MLIVVALLMIAVAFAAYSIVMMTVSSPRPRAPPQARHVAGRGEE